MQEGYHGGGVRPKKLTKKQINEMVNNMRKSSVISKKSKQYHQREEIEAENILNRLIKDD